MSRLGDRPVQAASHSADNEDRLCPVVAGVLLPVTTDPLAALAQASDHRLVYTDADFGFLFW